VPRVVFFQAALRLCSVWQWIYDTGHHHPPFRMY
jgi:hypothetical protein